METRARTERRSRPATTAPGHVPAMSATRPPGCRFPGLAARWYTPPGCPTAAAGVTRGTGAREASRGSRRASSTPTGGGPQRDGGRLRVPLDAVADYFADQGLDLVAVHDVLDRLAGLHQRRSQVVTLRYFGWMTVPEIAAALEVSVGTVERDWRIARAWLSNELGGEGVG